MTSFKSLGCCVCDSAQLRNFSAKKSIRKMLDLNNNNNNNKKKSTQENNKLGNRIMNNFGIGKKVAHDMLEARKPYFKIVFDKQNLNESPLSNMFLKNNQLIRVVLAGRDMGPYGTKNWAWLLEGHTFYATIEYTFDGLTLKWYRKKHFTLDDVYDGLHGNSDDIYFDDRFSTNMQFKEVLKIADNLKYKYNRKNFQLNKFDSNDFVKEFGFLLDPSFNIFIR